jgi:putative sterol carrier protein
VRTTEGDKVYHFTVDGGRASYRRGAAEKPRVTFMTRLPSFLRLVAGELDGIRALAQGRIKVKGNLLLARSFQGWFDTSA